MFYPYPAYPAYPLRGWDMFYFEFLRHVYDSRKKKRTTSKINQAKVKQKSPIITYQANHVLHPPCSLSLPLHVSSNPTGYSTYTRFPPKNTPRIRPSKSLPHTLSTVSRFGPLRTQLRTAPLALFRLARKKFPIEARIRDQGIASETQNLSSPMSTIVPLMRLILVSVSVWLCVRQKVSQV